MEKKMVFFFFFFLFLVFIPTASGEDVTTWHFSGNITCPYDTFVYTLEVYEVDYFLNGWDLLARLPEKRSHYPHTYQIDASETDDGANDDTFEIALRFSHICDTHGIWREWNYHIGKYPVRPGEITIIQNLDLFNKGEPCTKPCPSRK